MTSKPSLTDPFEVVHQREARGGFTVDYVQWNQVADRLDQAAPGWSFEVLQLHPVEGWAHGRLTIGEQKYENVGYAENVSADWKHEALKDAVSDAFKRCAALAGVARYLYDKDRTAAPKAAPRRPAARPRPAPEPPAVIDYSPEPPEDIDPDELDALFDESISTPTLPPANVQGMTSPQFFTALEAAGIDKRDAGNAARKLFGKDRWKITDLTDEERATLWTEELAPR
jgi:Rad52/22 family double-strand break repair protein